MKNTREEEEITGEVLVLAANVNVFSKVAMRVYSVHTMRAAFPRGPSVSSRSW